MATQRIVIVGGVAGGATAAARLRRLSEDAEIVVLERGPYISFANCGLPYYVGGDIAQRDALLLQTPEGLRARYNIDVRVRHEVLEIDRAERALVVRDLAADTTYRQPYDQLVLSPGAAPLRPPLPGIDHPRIMTVRTVPDIDKVKAAVDAGARSALVVGGGFIGLEMVENLVERGLTVHLVEMLDQVMPPLDREMAEPIHEQLRAAGVDLRLGRAAKSFAEVDGQIRAELADGSVIAADLVVLAIGVRPESTLAKDAGLQLNERGAIQVDAHMRTNDERIYAVGDAVAVTDWVTGNETMIPLAGPANRQGRIAADHIMGRSSAYRGTQGTSVVGLFGLTVAMTGASERTLTRADVAFEKVYLHPAQHVGYYPGAEQMTIKLLFDPGDGRVLGGQIVGRDGVDKRIDVLATAIQARMTVFDLEELELAYAPQYGAAKDALNMAGFVAANVVRQDTRIAHADRLGDALVLDVRDPDEFAVGAIPGATLIPLPELRARHAELPRDRDIVAYCQVGMRGYVAERLLGTLGYTVRNLSGGYRTWRMFHPAIDEEGASDTGGSGSGGAIAKMPGTAQAGGDSTAESVVTEASRGGASAGASTGAAGSASAIVVDEKLDASGLCCPGPIVALAGKLKAMQPGQVLEVRSTDGGFLSDVPAWCRSTGNALLETEQSAGRFVARIRKNGAVATREASATMPASVCGQTEAPSAPAVVSRNKTIIVFSGELDKVMAALIIANGAAAMGQRVTLFFTFWGLNALRRPVAPATTKKLHERMFGWMMPRGAARLPLSRMNMGGAGKAMMGMAMRARNVDPVEALLQQALSQGVRFVACSMSLDVMGIQPAELIDGVEVAGVAAYLAEADEANANLFI
jgi:NADPH-dependent 2,4-dienoyl-CoA reductase/sulfur reductase-like enzyme/peroxiredoxin family protein/TusA-related sulfurtransferase/rhodanese-related sulfurtransferase